MNGRMNDPAAIARFILAGRARFTFVSLVTGTRFTYRVEREKERGVVWFVSVLRGQDNESDYDYVGFIRKGFGSRLGSFVFKEGDAAPPSVLAFEWLWERLRHGNGPGVVSEVWHEGRCGRCGRALTVPESIASGLGPECASRAA